MMANNIQLKVEAIARMERLMIAPEKIKEFEQDGKVAVYDTRSGFRVPNDEEYDIIHRLEREGLEREDETLVFFIIRDYIPLSPDTVFTMDSFLYVSPEIVEWECCDPEYYDAHHASAYTHNYDVPAYSEHGDVSVLQTSEGGLKRAIYHP